MRTNILTNLALLACLLAQLVHSTSTPTSSSASTTLRPMEINIKLIKSVDEIKTEQRNRSSSKAVGRVLKGPTQADLNAIFAHESSSILLKTPHSRMLVNDMNGTIRTLSTGGDSLTQNMHKMTKLSMRVSRNLLRMYGYVDDDDQYEVLEKYEAPKQYCPYSDYTPYCDFTYSYRMIDGSCNNKEYPTWGMRKMPFKRLLNPEYDDNLDQVRSKSYSKESKLPNPRLVALRVHNIGRDGNAAAVTNLLVHFSQLVDHDITLTALISDEDGQPIRCFCSGRDDDCINIKMFKEDRLNFDQRCMVTPRSSASFNHENCRLGHREQLNMLTSWLDLSNVYGNDLQASIELRLMTGGKLNSSMIRGIRRDYLPFNLDGKCLNIPEGKPCFQSGDIRTNQNIILSALQTLWMREHNRIADVLARLNPGWSDERLFQEARRITIAEFQHIIFNEWLPVLVGEKVAKLYGLLPLNQDFFFRYDSKLYPNIINEFATAAFRFGHTLVKTSLVKSDIDYRSFDRTNIKDAIFNSVVAFRKGGLDSYLLGTLVDSAQAYDSRLNDHLNNHLFEGLNKEIPTRRFSLSALNINRGRDHGIRGYNHYRALCGLNYARSFDDLYNIPDEVRERLAQVYDHVNDIDLFTGGVSEHPIDGGVVGPTFACIIAKQFRDLKFGDRFYYENGHDKNTRFTYKQLDQIRRVSLARVICDNVDVNYLQKNVFLKADFQTNPLISCYNVHKMDYSVWRSYD